jgi:hypothetical protein
MRAGAHHRDPSATGNRQSRNAASTSRLGLAASTALTPLLFQFLPLHPTQASINQQRPKNYRVPLTYCFASNMTPITGWACNIGYNLFTNVLQMADKPGIGLSKMRL